MSPISKNLHRLVKWHFWSSTTFEIMKTAHQVGLFMILAPASYGHIGSIFSLIYLSAHLAGLEGGNALVPFANGVANAPNRTQLLNSYLIIPQFFLHLVAATITHTVFTAKLLPHPKPLYITLLIAITILEGIRMATRVVAHTITDSTRIIPLEVGLTIGYFAFIWIGYLCGMPLNIQSIFIPFMASSLIATALLINAVYNYPTPLPKLQTPILPTPQENIRIRLSLTMLHLPHNFFSANLLVPFFSHTVGFRFAGFAKLASEAAHTIKAIIKSSIGFSANAIFSTYVKNRAQAFDMLWKLLINGTVTTAIISIMTAIPCFVMNFMQAEGIMVIAFSTLCMVDYLFVIYEHFFVVANATNIIARYRIIEAIISSVVLMSAKQQPIIIITTLILLRSGSLSATIWHAHKLWRIRPKLSVEWRNVLISLAFGMGMSIVSAHVKSRVKQAAQHTTAQSGAPYPPLSENTTITE